MATLLVARHCQDSGLTEIEPCCSALIASVEYLYSYVSMLQREESPGGLSTSLTPTVAPCAAPRLLSHLTLCQLAQSTVQRARLRNTVLVLSQHLSQITMFLDHSYSDFVLLSLTVITLPSVYFVIPFPHQKTFE